MWKTIRGVENYQQNFVAIELQLKYFLLAWFSR